MMKLKESREDYLKKRSQSSLQMDLRSCNLYNFPKEILELVALEVVLASDNSISNLDGSIADLANLRELWLACNQLASLPAEIGSLPRLTLLNCFLNKLTQIPKEIGNLKSLKILNLSANKLTTIPTTLAKLENLMSLELAGNQLQSFPSELCSLSKLTDLDLSSNNISCLPNEIGNLQLLRKLQLQNNHISILPDSIAHLGHLETLLLRNNQLSAFPSSVNKLSNTSQNLWSLYELDLSRNRLVTLPYGIGFLPEITILNATYNPLVSIPKTLVEEGDSALLNYLKLQVPRTVFPPPLVLSNTEPSSPRRSRSRSTMPSPRLKETASSPIPESPRRAGVPISPRINTERRRSISVPPRKFVWYLSQLSPTNLRSATIPKEPATKNPSSKFIAWEREKNSNAENKLRKLSVSVSSPDLYRLAEAQDEHKPEEPKLGEVSQSASHPDLYAFALNLTNCPCCHKTKGQIKSASFNELEAGKCSNCGHQQEEHIYEQLVKQVESQNEKIKQLEVELAKKVEVDKDLLMISMLIDLDEIKFRKQPLSGSSSSVDKRGVIIGKGQFSKVYLGTYRNQDVAVKILAGSSDNIEIGTLKKELYILSSLKSPNLVYFYGAILQPKICIVTEYCQHGSLFDVLKKNDELSWNRTLKFCMDIARGVFCLHSWKPPVVHRDLKSLNLFVDSNYVVKVGDFGTSRFVNGGQMSTLGKIRGTYAYCAPEIYFGSQFTNKSDVYSIAVIFWEIITRCLKKSYEMPFKEFKEISFEFQVIISVAQKGIRPTIHPKCPKIMSDLITDCWKDVPADRPDCNQIIDRLSAINNEYEKNAKKWDQLLK